MIHRTGGIELDTCCICKEMKRLQFEQRLLAEFGKDCRYIELPKRMDTIPFMLVSSKEFKPFMAILHGSTTSFFRLESIDEHSCCAQLSLLKPVDMVGRHASSVDDLYALQKTKICIHLNLCCFIAINPMPPILVERPLPIIEVKA